MGIISIIKTTVGTRRPQFHQTLVINEVDEPDERTPLIWISNVNLFCDTNSIYIQLYTYIYHYLHDNSLGTDAIYRHF